MLYSIDGQTLFIIKSIASGIPNDMTDCIYHVKSVAAKTGRTTRGSQSPVYWQSMLSRKTPKSPAPAYFPVNNFYLSLQCFQQLRCRKKCYFVALYKSYND